LPALGFDLADRDLLVRVTVGVVLLTLAVRALAE
jgi:hypothetical protein